MKRIILTLIFGLFVVTQLFPQKKHKTTYEVRYALTYSIDSLHPQERGTDDFYLYSGSGFGVFTYYDYIKQKKKIKDLKEKYGNDVNTDVSFVVSFDHLSLKKSFYKNLHSGKVTTVAKLDQKKYSFEEPKTSFDWKIRDSTKTYHGHSAQKATTFFAGRDYVAWFTMDIPLRDGPYLFSGLPGLIVELYDVKRNYVFKLKSVKKLKKPIAWDMPADVETITKEKYRTLFEKFFKTASLTSDVSYMVSKIPGVSGGVITDAQGNITKAELKLNGEEINLNELRRRYKKILKRQNNPIELK